MMMYHPPHPVSITPSPRPHNEGEWLILDAAWLIHHHQGPCMYLRLNDNSFTTATPTAERETKIK